MLFTLLSGAFRCFTRRPNSTPQIVRCSSHGLPRAGTLPRPCELGAVLSPVGSLQPRCFLAAQTSSGRLEKAAPGLQLSTEGLPLGLRLGPWNPLSVSSAVTLLASIWVVAWKLLARCFPSLKDHSPALPVVQCLETIVFFGLTL
nr:uncharacterized protein LOC107129356 [Macaca fascicularis]